MRSYIFRVELEQEEDGRWSAVVPALVGCAVWGETSEEALEAIHEGAKAYVEVLTEDGRAVPTDDEGAVEVVEGAAVSVIA